VVTYATPTIRVLQLGAGVQSTALALLAARGDLPKPDCAIFADTGWEPSAVYRHLDRLESDILAPAGIALHRVSSGNIREDSLSPTHRFASMPLFVRNPDGSEGMGRRQCTSEYKLKPIKAKVRELLGAEPRGRVKRGLWAESWIGFSADEAHRALDAHGTMYLVSAFPLLDLGLSRTDCEVINRSAGYEAQKSACIGCPYHGNRQWREMRDGDPEAWADAVDFDHDIRKGSARANAQGQLLRGENYLHRSRVPLDLAPIDLVTRAERKSWQTDLFTESSATAIYNAMANDEPIGCGPFTCRSSDEVQW
jgi:hypothetical protein